MDTIDMFLGAALASASGLVLVLWTRVMVQVSAMKQAGNAPVPAEGGGLESPRGDLPEKQLPLD